MEHEERRGPAGPGEQPVRGRARRGFYYGWVIVGVIFLAEFTISGMGGSTVALFFQPMSRETGWSLTALTAAVAAQTVAGMAVAPFVGVVLDRYGAKPVLLAGTVVAGVGFLLLTSIQAVWQFWVLYALASALGLSELGRLSAPVVVAKWFVRKRGRAMAVAISGNMIGPMVMAPLIALSIASVGWRHSWGILGLAQMAIMVPVVALFMRRQPEDLGLLPDGDVRDATPAPGPGNPPGPATTGDEVMWTLGEALRSRTLWVLVASMSMVNLAVVPLVTLQVPFFTNEGLSNQGAAYVFTASAVCYTVSRLIWGFLVERLPVRLCLAGMAAGRSLGVVMLVAVPFPYNIGPFLLFSGLLGGAASVLQPVAYANYYGRASTGSIQGALRPLMSLPQLAGPLLVAALFDATGSFDAAFMAFGMLGFAGTGLVLLARPPVKRPAAA